MIKMLLELTVYIDVYCILDTVYECSYISLQSWSTTTLPQ